MRSILYVTAGILAGLLGFTSSQAILNLTPILYWVKRPEYIIFPISSLFLAVSTVVAEIFLNNPTRYRINREKLPIPLLLAVIIGIGSGLMAAFLSVALSYSPNLNLAPTIAKAIGWILMGVSAGVADGFSWQFRTIEGGQKERVIQRLISSVRAGALAGVIAFCLYFLASKSKYLVGFFALGGFLGLFLNRAGAGVLSFALRAGAGFELNSMPDSYPRIKSTGLKLNCSACDDYGKPLSAGYGNKIEEGISIELPQRGEITIGSHKDSDIFVSILPERCAKIILNAKTASLEALADNIIQIGKNRILLMKGEKRDLFHNQVLTLYNSNQDNFVRFVFYDRFLDPQG